MAAAEAWTNSCPSGNWSATLWAMRTASADLPDPGAPDSTTVRIVALLPESGSGRSTCFSMRSANVARPVRSTTSAGSVGTAGVTGGGTWGRTSSFRML